MLGLYGFNLMASKYSNCKIHSNSLVHPHARAGTCNQFPHQQQVTARIHSFRTPPPPPGLISLRSDPPTATENGYSYLDCQFIHSSGMQFPQNTNAWRVPTSQHCRNAATRCDRPTFTPNKRQCQSSPTSRITFANKRRQHTQ